MNEHIALGQLDGAVVSIRYADESRSARSYGGSLARSFLVFRHGRKIS